MTARKRRARIEDIHDLALAVPHMTVERVPGGNPVYEVGGKSFVFFRNARPDAFDPETGERYDDVIVIWVPEEADKQARVQDIDSPFFTPRTLTATARSSCAPVGSTRSTAMS